MRTIDSTLVDIARDFLDAHQALREVARRHRAGELRLEEALLLVGDDEESVLFRLKERCHRVFRADENGEIGPGGLFDLAVGSLFHEAMKFRENVYTRDVYGPRVRALRRAQVEDGGDLLREFEKIIEDSALRLEESLFEAETLLRQTVGQFRVLLCAHANNAFVTRYLIEHREQVEDVLSDRLEAVLDEVHGDAGLGFARAGRSYVDSGFFEAGRLALAEAASLGHPAERIAGLDAYAKGMQAYLEGRYRDAIAVLGEWAQLPPEADGIDGALAIAALSRVGQLVGEEEAAELGADATALAEQIRRRASAA
jgi:hypothetical protein